MTELPVIDVGALVAPSADDVIVRGVAAALDQACREVGFFYVVGHGVDPELLPALDHAARTFFASSEADKELVAMRRAGRAWRGWFPLGGELTSGIADQKEGIYFGAELGPTDPRVVAGVPLHGANLFPAHPPELRPLVLRYLDAMTGLAQTVLGGLALALGLERSWFVDHLTDDPLVLFRIFRYPPSSPTDREWGVAEHTDYGLLTVLAQDPHPGLQVRTPDGWVDAPPIEQSFVCNLGDMLERLTGGRWRSTPHRVRNTGDGDRLSFPFFLDPAWDARVERLPIVDRPPVGIEADRWDQANVHGYTGTYGDYIRGKVSKVFPALVEGRAADPN